ncbi:MAG: PHP domain-containing protein [Clostridia bacterium]|nr:PHP domain-containing protein [Clostridia bacterium]
MQYKTELHAHTSEVSPCAELTAQEVAERYIAQGYTTLVVTNHYSAYIMERIDGSWEDKARYYLAPVRAMKEYAGERLNVILGCELRFRGSANDYLIFGLDEEFLFTHPNLQDMSLKDFSALARENGLLVVQAHPFRNGITVVDPSYLDGMETFNGHVGHDSRNKIADAWAKMHGLFRTSGTDFHHPYQSGVAGILTDEPITCGAQLCEILKSGNYTLHCSGPRAEAEGISDHPAKY